MNVSSDLARRALAEALGTGIMVLVGTAAIAVDASYGGIGHLGVALAFGLVVMAMIYAVGEVSGAHINPAVSIAFVIAGRLPARYLPAYLAAQCLGAMLASGALALMLPDSPTLGATTPAVGLGTAFAIEVFITAVLMFVIITVATGAKEKGPVAALAIGGTVGLLALVFGPLTGASMNPARSLGPAIVGGELPTLWIYLLGPMIGAALGVYACRAIRGPACCPEGEPELG